MQASSSEVGGAFLLQLADSFQLPPAVFVKVSVHPLACAADGVHIDRSTITTIATPTSRAIGICREPTCLVNAMTSLAHRVVSPTRLDVSWSGILHGAAPRLPEPDPRICAPIIARHCRVCRDVEPRLRHTSSLSVIIGERQ